MTAATTTTTTTTTGVGGAREARPAGQQTGKAHFISFLIVMDSRGVYRLCRLRSDIGSHQCCTVIVLQALLSVCPQETTAPENLPFCAFLNRVLDLYRATWAKDQPAARSIGQDRPGTRTIVRRIGQSEGLLD